MISHANGISLTDINGDGFEDMDRRVPNIDLINELVGWKPKRDLTTMITDISTEMKKSS